MFNNELMADVHFVVGPLGSTHRVPAHKVGKTNPSSRSPAILGCSGRARLG